MKIRKVVQVRSSPQVWAWPGCSVRAWPPPISTNPRTRMPTAYGVANHIAERYNGDLNGIGRSRSEHGRGGGQQPRWHEPCWGRQRIPSITQGDFAQDHNGADKPGK